MDEGRKRRKRDMPKIKHRKLRRERALGLYTYANRLIEIDPRLKAYTFLDTLIHELLHDSFPDMSEHRVTMVARRIKRGVWEAGYRRIAP